MSGAIAGDVALTVDGQVHRGWRAVKVSMGLDAAAAEISIELAERWAGAEDAEAIRRSIRPGADFSLALEDETVVEGFLDSLEVSYDDRSHTLTVTGRERTGDLVDCAAQLDGPHEFAGVGLEEAARRICTPFGVRVRADGALGAAFPRFSIQPGETAWEAIARGARERAVIATGDGRGTLLLTRAGQGGEAAGALRLGGQDGNIRRANGSFDFKERHSVVVVRGQAEGSATGGQGQARATDPDVTRYRPRVVLAEGQGEGVTFQDRATWEVRVAAGKGRRVRYTVPGWRGRSGALWRPNTRAMVEDAYLDLSRELLISNVTYSLTPDGGTLTELQLAPVDAYSLIPERSRKGKGESGDTPMETRRRESGNDGRDWERVRVPAT
jgi:prophage tail gpP-like protein